MLSATGGNNWIDQVTEGYKNKSNTSRTPIVQLPLRLYKTGISLNELPYSLASRKWWCVLWPLRQCKPDINITNYHRTLVHFYYLPSNDTSGKEMWTAGSHQRGYPKLNVKYHGLTFIFNPWVQYACGHEVLAINSQCVWEVKGLIRTERQLIHQGRQYIWRIWDKYKDFESRSWKRRQEKKVEWGVKTLLMGERWVVDGMMKASLPPYQLIVEKSFNQPKK